MKEKHRRAVHFSKAGLEVPDRDKPFERKGGDSATGGTELEVDRISSRQDFNKDDSLQPTILRGEALKILSKTDKIPSRKDFKDDDLFQPMILQRESQNYESVPLDSSQGAVRCIENSGSVCLILYFCFSLANECIGCVCLPKYDSISTYTWTHNLFILMDDCAYLMI